MMAVKKQPLRIVSYSEPDPEIELTDEQFEKLEAAYDRTLSPLARSNLKESCNKFLFLKKIEVIRQTWRDVENQIGPYRDAAQAMWKIAYELNRSSDSYYEFEQILDDVLERQLLRFDAENELLHFDPKVTEASIVPLSDDYDIPNASYFIRLSDKLIQEIAMSLKVTIGAVEKRIAEKTEEAGKDSQAIAPIEVLILSVTQWAKMHSLPISPTRNGGEPAPFANFMTALLGMLPDNYKETNYSAVGGVSAKIGRVRKAYKNRN